MTSPIELRAPPGMSLPHRLLEAARAAYGTPPRHYHTWTHVLAVADRFAEVQAGPGFVQPEPTFLAVIAHDAIYEVGERDNEERSARLARHWAERFLEPAWGPRAAALVRATADHHGLPVGEDPDLDLFLDCDLAVLGADDATYDAYAHGVHAEYAPLAGDAYAGHRARFIEGFLQQAWLFRSRWFRERLEARARRNLLRELRQLR